MKTAEQQGAEDYWNYSEPRQPTNEDYMSGWKDSMHDHAEPDYDEDDDYDYRYDDDE